MHYSGTIYRPPFESASLLLQVTAGCSHNRCAFCTMYRDVPFRMEPMEQIERDLDEAARRYPHVRRVFLENGDPFVLSAERLAAIAERIHERLPEVETIAMYASVLNIQTKTDAELRALRALGINELNIGVESGLDDALQAMEKGYTAAEAVAELTRLRVAGIDFGANVILGAAGAGRGPENAVMTAELLNATKPYLIFTGTIHADPGCPLYEKLQSGAFTESTVGEYLDEEETLLQCLDIDCRYFGLHPSNIVPMNGRLPEGKETLLAQVRAARERFTARQLAFRPRRYGEGAVVIED